jgi:HSP20 family molecular chaperone IbpA
MLTVRTTPVRTSPVFDRSFDRAFDQLVGSFFDQRRAPGPVVDASWQDDAYVLTVDLPGVPASAVEVQVAGRALTLQATTPTLDWRRSVRLSGRLDPEQVAASHVDGRLTVRIGTVDAPVARQVAISATPLTTPALEAATDEQIGAGDEAAHQSDETNAAG